MDSKSDKGYVLRFIIACLAAILIFHFAWTPYLLQNWSNSLFFTIGDILLFAGFTGVSVKAYKEADDPNFDYMRYVFMVIAIASCIWAAAWSTGLMNNIEQGIH